MYILKVYRLFESVMWIRNQTCIKGDLLDPDPLGECKSDPWGKQLPKKCAKPWSKNLKTYIHIEDLLNQIKYCKNFKTNLIHISKSTLYDLFCLLSSKFLPPLIPIQISICLWVRIHMEADTDIGFGSASTSLVRICHLSKRAKLIL